MLSDRCPVLSLSWPVCLSVALEYCGQMVGRIKMKLETWMQVGLGAILIVLDGDPAASQKGGTAPPHFRPMAIVAKWLDGSTCHLVWR